VLYGIFSLVGKNSYLTQPLNLCYFLAKVLAEEKDLKVILTLNDLPDLIFRPLYLDWQRYDAQTTYIVKRYRNESTILAWDLRNEGDLDYGARIGDEAKFKREEVLNWLDHISKLVHESDSNHLITAGWWGDPTPTEPFIDFLSFHHWHDISSLQQKVDAYSQKTTKPLLLQEVGYHSWETAPLDQRSEAQQAELLKDAIEVVEMENIAGWMIWTAFDFQPVPGQAPIYEHYFGLWRNDLSPKPAVAEIFAD
jgi:endo-1,4-beta-mannosidase